MHGQHDANLPILHTIGHLTPHFQAASLHYHDNQLRTLEFENLNAKQYSGRNLPIPFLKSSLLLILNTDRHP